MIEVENLTKYYGQKLALDKISFSVKKGEILGFLGPNGAGKSTAMKIITCFLSPTEGTVKVDGQDVVNNSLEVRKRIGYLPEHPPIYLDMTVRNYLDFVAKIKGVARKRVKDSVSTVVEKCGLKKYYNTQCKALSKGYRQRVGIAQAMIHEPLLLVLDEPTIGLDPIQIIEIRELIKTFGGDHTVILSTHILPEVDMTCERVVIISDGNIVAQDSTANLKRKLPGQTILNLEVRGNSAGFEDKLLKIHGIEKLERLSSINNNDVFRMEISNKSDIRPDISRAVMESNMDIVEFKTAALTLEEIFIKVTMN